MIAPFIVKFYDDPYGVRTYRVGHNASRMEEIREPGPYGVTVPYIRVHVRDNRYLDVPKHKVDLVEYQEQMP